MPSWCWDLMPHHWMPCSAITTGVSDKAVNFVEGITAAVGAGTRVEYDQGCDFRDTVHFGGLWAAGNADITIAVIGLTPVYEGEEGDAFLAPGGGDKKDLRLPQSQIAFMRALRKAHNKPIVAVITAGSAVDLSTIEPYVDALIYAWYPGEQGGNALADLLFGKVAPAGRLPVTFYQSFDNLPPYESYAVQGRSYRYFEGPVQYPFGFGLSYTSFAYEWTARPQAPRSLKDTLRFSLTVKNTGLQEGDEVVQAYVRYPAGDRMPLKELKGFQRVSIPRGGEQRVAFSIPVSELEKWDLKESRWKLYPGTYHIVLGEHSADSRLSSSFEIRKKVK